MILSRDPATLHMLCAPQSFGFKKRIIVHKVSSRLEKKAISCCLPHEANSSQKEHVSPALTVTRNSGLDVVTEEGLGEKAEIRSVKQEGTVLSERWREIQGGNNWEGLLNPIDPLLRSEIIRYGEFAQMCYDAFDFDCHSKYCGSCKYNHKKLFEKMDMADCGYDITRYLYATSSLHLPKFFRRSDSPQDQMWSRDSNWIGFVAVATAKREIERLGRRDILVAWRGTVTVTEWIDDLMDFQIPAGLDPAPEGDHPFPNQVKVETGFLDLYMSSKQHSRFNKTSARQQLLSEISRLLGEFPDEKLSLTITGHSLGGALALLSAYDIAAAGSLNVGHGRSGNSTPITVFSFSAPRVGNGAFRSRCNKLGVKVLRVVNTHDGVPKVPGIFLNETCHLPWFSAWAYFHVGTELKFDSEASPHLKKTRDPGSHHNLEALLHLIDGYHGAGESFQSATGRDLALVNKASDCLVKERLIPPFWWQDENKGLVKNERGQWVQPERDEENMPQNYYKLY